VIEAVSPRVPEYEVLVEGIRASGFAPSSRQAVERRDATTQALIAFYVLDHLTDEGVRRLVQAISDWAGGKLSEMFRRNERWADLEVYGERGSVIATVRVPADDPRVQSRSVES